MADTKATLDKVTRSEQPLDTGWRFHLGDTDTALIHDLDDSDWQDVRLPHDWAINCPTDPDMEEGRAQGFQRRAHVGWYRRRLSIKPEPGRKFWLRFDGAYRHGEVWINGKSLGVRPSGYATRIHDITDLLNEDGDQLLAVRCDNTGHDADRWYCGAGLYRRVWLTVTADLAVAPWGIWVKTPEVTPQNAKIECEVKIRNDRSEAVRLGVAGEILDMQGKRAGSFIAGVGDIEPLGETSVTLQAVVAEPALWSPESPALYRATIRIIHNGVETDCIEQTFGIRHFNFSAEGGFELNGVKRKMKGVCLHHDLGCLGTAFFAAGWERRLNILKELGCDSIRTSHNPPDPALLDLCDRLGFLVIDEIYDKWRGGCSGKYFDEWWQRDLEAMVLRDRNHPSVVVWSMGNEVEDQGSPKMIEICSMLSEHTRRLDPTRPTTVALIPHCLGDFWVAPVEEKVKVVKAIGQAVDLVGLNYQDQWYEDYHAAMPEKVFISTEAFHFFQHRDNGSWAMHAENPWLEVAQASYVVGQFVWTAIDYLGEAVRGWPVRGWSGAMTDTTANIKPRAWWHGAAWRDEPIVFAAARFREADSFDQADWAFPPLVDHWNLPIREQEIVEVWVFSNGHSVELLLNGSSKGTRVMDECHNRIASFYLPYQPGHLVAVSRDETGNELARHELKTAGAPARIELSADRVTLRADDQDLAHISITIVDADGVRIPQANDAVGVEVQGAARLIGMDNGDLTCHEPFVAIRRSAFHGRCMAVLRAGHTPGNVTVTAIVPGLPAATINLEVRQA